MRPQSVKDREGHEPHYWSFEVDLNHRSPAYQADALTGLGHRTKKRVVRTPPGNTDLSDMETQTTNAMPTQVPQVVSQGNLRKGSLSVTGRSRRIRTFDFFLVREAL